MKDNFDNLSDDFLDGDKKPNRKGGKSKLSGFGLERNDIPLDIDNLPDDLPDEIKNIIKTLSDVKERGGDMEDIMGNLGDPDETETSEEDGKTIDKSTWNTEFGQVTRISIGGPNDMDLDGISDLFRKKLGLGGNKNKNLTFEDKLEIALENEDYLEAARLRDKISAKKNKEIEKAEKKENSSNVDIDKDSEQDFWDF
jgi:hypothetical protein